MESLPGEVIGLICEELANKQDFNGLFTCAVAGKGLVAPALLWLYRIHNFSPLMSSEVNDADFTKHTTIEARVNAHKTTLHKWALLWKSIIRSSLGDTAHPYCLYIRFLDLRNLAELLDDPAFRDYEVDNFFEGAMSVFKKEPATTMKQKVRSARRNIKRIDVALTLDLVGESITKFVKDSADRNSKAVALEDLAGNISATALPTWVGRLSRLRSMTLWDGSVLDGTVAAAIAKSCPSFDDLTYFACHTSEADLNLAAFFAGLPPNTLRSFAALNASSVGPRTLLSVNNHSQSLKKLKLDGLTSDAVKRLSFLQGCGKLVSLEISDQDGYVDLEETENVVYLELIAWLGSCNHLRELYLRGLVNGPKILTEVCLQNNIRLETLQVRGYQLANNQDFHKALSHQTNLESLELHADPEGNFRDDIDTLVSSISQLKKLKYLDLLTTSDYFRTFELITLAKSLPNLEEFSIGGYDVTDDLWHGLTELHHLRILNLHAVTLFSFDAILTYISTLRETNQGMLLSIMSQMAEHSITVEQEEVLREALASKVDGKFDFTYFRDPDSESESLSD